MKGWRTIIFNVAMIAAHMAEVLPPRPALWVTVIGDIILRIFTNTPVGRSEPTL